MRIDRPTLVDLVLLLLLIACFAYATAMHLGTTAPPNPY